MSSGPAPILEGSIDATDGAAGKLDDVAWLTPIPIPELNEAATILSAVIKNGQDKRGGVFFRLLWAFDLLVAAAVIVFFVWGLSDGSVSSFNIMLWLGMLALVGGVVVGGRTLHRTGHTAAATLLLMVLAIPGLGFTLFLLMVLILQPRWN